MAASMTAMIVNFIFNILLIFGYLGFPKLGVTGAAIATVISRFVEAGIIVIRAKLSRDKYEFLIGVYKNFHVPTHLIWPIMSKTLPLLANECLWSMGQAVLLQSYSILRFCQIFLKLPILCLNRSVFFLHFVCCCRRFLWGKPF